MTEAYETGSVEESDISGDEENEENSSIGVVLQRTHQKKNRVPSGLWTISQQTTIEEFVKKTLYKCAPVMDAEQFQDGAIFGGFASVLNMEADDFTPQQRKSLIAMTKYRLDQTRSRDRKIAFRNMSTYSFEIAHCVNECIEQSANVHRQISLGESGYFGKIDADKELLGIWKGAPPKES
jgi:hypothetical protein